MDFHLADLFECVADAVPERTALVAGDLRLRYDELDARATRFANHLAGAGIGAGDHVGIHARNRVEWIEAMLGAYKLRAVPINVNYRYVEDELVHLFGDADLSALVFEREFAPRIAAVRDRLPMLRHLVALEDESDEGDAGLAAVEYEAVLAEASPERKFGPRSGDDRYLIYTGGTTGLPKGTVWRHRDIFVASMGGGNLGGPPIERPEAILDKAREGGPTYLVTAPLMHAGGQWVCFITLFWGAKLVLYTGQHFDAHELWRLVERERVQAMAIIGDAMARPLVEALAEPGAAYDLSSVALVGSGGAILSKEVKQALRSHLPPNAFVMDAYGASETGHVGTVYDAGGPAAGPRFTLTDKSAVFDDEGRRIEPGSERIGRIAHRGAIPLGYWKDEARTRATFLELEGERWVVPGDFARVEADGSVTLLGRGSVCINSGGEKVFPEEVEAAVKSHPEVFDAVVVGVPDERFGERVAAVVKPRPGRTPELASVSEHCRARVAGYKVPRSLVLVDEIPRTPVGKPDYRSAARIARDAQLS